jgi:hypothetical protein
VLREWSVARKFAGFASESPILHRKVASSLDSKGNRDS